MKWDIFAHVVTSSSCLSPVFGGWSKLEIASCAEDVEAREKFGDCESRRAASAEKIDIVCSGRSPRIFVVLPHEEAPSSIESSQLRLEGSDSVLG